MICSETLELISAALDGELSPAERSSLDAHLADCPDCTALFDELAGQSRLLRDLDCDVPRDLSGRILSALPPQSRTKPRPVIHWKRWGTLAACLVIVLWAGIALPGRTGKDAAPESMHIMTADSRTTADADTVSTQPDLSGEADPALPEPEACFAPESPQAQESEQNLSSSVLPIGPNGMDDQTGDCIQPDKVQYLRVEWHDGLNAPSARLISSRDELAACLSRYGVSGQDALLDSCGGDFFSSSGMVAILLTENSGSVSHEVEGILPVEGGYELIIRRQVPEMGTCDMAAWLILLTTDTQISPDDGLTVVLNTKIP